VRGLSLILILVFVLTALVETPAAEPLPSLNATQTVVSSRIYLPTTAVKPGEQTALALVLSIQPPYHINANTAKEPYIPTSVELINAPEFIRASTPLFPDSHVIDFGPEGAREKIEVFSGEIIVYLPLVLLEEAPVGETELMVKTRYQACDNTQCLFPTAITNRVKLTVVAASTAVSSINAEIFRELNLRRPKVKVSFFGYDFSVAGTSVGLLMIIAMIGGFLLNFTPCVLPLIPIKILGLSQVAGNRRRCFLLGCSLSAGVLFFWLVLGVIISTVSGFDSTNKLFQYPLFTISVGLIICIMALGMTGFFSVGLPQWIYRINPSQETAAGAAGFGIMSALLSTPCTAPFMGAAAAWAATQKPLLTMTTFGAIGIGMALPYLLLSAYPAFVRRVPRAGPASELIKQVMGLLMWGAGSYFLGTGLAGLLAEPPDPPSQQYWWAVASFMAAAGSWLAWRTFQLSQKWINRVVFAGLGLLLVITGLQIGRHFTRKSPVQWIYYTPQRFDQARQAGKIIVLEFTASWCLNCHALEQGVLHQTQVVAALNQTNVAPIKVDITGKNPAGNRKLVEVGRHSIPYLVIYDPDGKEIFSSDAYTAAQILEAIDRRK